jgi:hypothetical protein
VEMSYINDIMEDDEARTELRQRMDNLSTLLMIKRRLGELVDINDRLFGYCGCGECSNFPFTKSSISVVLSLPDDKEDGIEENNWTNEVWKEEGLPLVTFGENEDEEIYSISIPFHYDLQAMETALEKLAPENIFSNIKLHICNENTLLVYCKVEDSWEREFSDDISEICIRLRHFIEGGVLNA